MTAETAHQPWRHAARAATEIAIAGLHRRLDEPGWLAAGIRLERADAIATYHRQLALRASRSRGELIRRGYHLGPAPYGYLLHTAAPPAGTASTAAGDGARRRLVPDSATAEVVRLIFRWRVTDRLAHAAIARILTARPQDCPPPRHPRTGAVLPWTAARVTRILANPRYTGRQVLRSQRRERGCTSPAVVTAQPVHPPLVDDTTYRRAQQLAGAPIPRGLDHTPAPQNTPTEDTA